jgi:hypothetical protein
VAMLLVMALDSQFGYNPSILFHSAGTAGE